MSAAAVGAALAGAGILGLNAAEAYAAENNVEEKATYAVTSVFNATNSASVTGGKFSGTGYTKLVFSNGGTVNYGKDLAYKWMTSKGEEEYFSFEFAFGDLHFTTFSLTFNASENSATANGKAVNVIKFTNNSGVVKAKVNDGAETFIDASSVVKISLAAPSDSASGKYGVSINGVSAGQFENVSGSYANAAKVVPITFSAATDESNQEIYVMEMNGQTFDLDSDGYITDNASPVLVVNQDVKFFSLGSSLKLDYSVVDVLASYPTNTVQYSQYQVGEEVTYDTLTTSSSFAKTSTYDAYGCEYISVKFILADKDTTRSNEVMLSWYADSSYITPIEGVDYLSAGIDGEGPAYGCVTTDHDSKTSVLDKENEAYLAYVDAVEEASGNIGVENGNYFYLPSLESLISDGKSSYSELTFNIYYKKQGASSTMSRTSLSYDQLFIEVATAGKYVFRVTANDPSGNPMQIYSNGGLVSVTSDNVWNFDCIPEFSFMAYNFTAKSEKTGTVGTEYAFTDFDIGDDFDNYTSEYSLWYFSGAYGSVSYTDLITMANKRNGFESYIGAASGMCLNRITDYNSSIDKTNNPDGWAASDNAYKWDVSTKTFTPQKVGYYVLRVVLTDSQTDSEAIAYKVISVEAAAEATDTTTDDTTFSLKDNLLSIVLIGVVVVAIAVMIVLYARRPKTYYDDTDDEDDEEDEDDENF